MLVVEGLGFSAKFVCVSVCRYICFSAQYLNNCCR